MLVTQSVSGALLTVFSTHFFWWICWWVYSFHALRLIVRCERQKKDPHALCWFVSTYWEWDTSSRLLSPISLPLCCVHVWLPNMTYLSLALSLHSHIPFSIRGFFTSGLLTGFSPCSLSPFCVFPVQYTVVHEGQTRSTYASFSKRLKANKWSDEDTEKFYQVWLSLFALQGVRWLRPYWCSSIVCYVCVGFSLFFVCMLSSWLHLSSNNTESTMLWTYHPMCITMPRRAVLACICGCF